MFSGVSITGISAAVPIKVVDNLSLGGGLFSDQEIHNTVATTGIRYRRVADPGICASDLAVAAAESLFEEMGLDRSSIDYIIFMSQTPDYRQPATAALIQNRLGLRKDIGALDINMACSGYIYGLSTAYSFCNSKGIDRVLLLVGETLSKIVSKDDRATSLLFGDGAAATLIEKTTRESGSAFSLNTDGSRYDVLLIKGGGYRYPSSPSTLEKKLFSDGSVRSMENLYMDGIEVFNFTMNEVPRDVRKLLAECTLSVDSLDYLVFHQANKIITDFIVKKLKLQSSKVPYCLDRFGNTSAVSIPLTLVSELKNELQSGALELVLSGFGGGLSWATAYVSTDNVCVAGVIEV